MTDEEKFIQSLYEDSNERLKELYKVEKESRDELLQNIALIMLTYTVSNDLMSLTRKDKTKEYSKLSNMVLKVSKSNSKVQEGVLTEVLTDVVTKTFDFYKYNANLKEVKEIIERNFKGKHFSERVWENEEQVAKHIHKKVNDFLNGKINVNQIKKDIEKNFNASAYNTKRLVETEVNRCSSNAFDRFCKEVGVKKVRYNATLDSKLCEDCAQFHDKVFDFNEKIEVPRHPLCRCFYEIVDGNIKANVSNSGKDDIINIQNNLFRKQHDEREDLKFITDDKFDKLTIKARKNGALIIRGTEEVEKHLNDFGAAAANIGDVLLFRKDVCISEVLEETYHFEQNLRKQNDDKGEPLRSILNEIDAKEYLINNSKKYKIPRNEIEITMKQLEYYKNALKEVMEGE